MKRNLGLMFCGLALLTVVSCFDPSQPNYQYFPDMYESVGYDTTKSLVMPLLADLAIDPEPAVRQHMVEQLSSVATVNLVILCFLFCNLVVINYLNLPIFVVLCK